MRKALRLCTPPDPAKVWDNLLAVADLETLEKSVRVLDVGCRSGILLTWLHQRGFRQLWGIDDRLPWPPIRAALTKGLMDTSAASLACLTTNWSRLRRGHAEDLPFPDLNFEAVTSMSVIEHGVNQARFLSEAYRVLTSGGLLILSTDFWHEHVDRDSRLFGKLDMVFGPSDIASLLEAAKKIGFAVPTAPLPSPTGGKPVIQFGGLSYTFLYMVLIKSSPH